MGLDDLFKGKSEEIIQIASRHGALNVGLEWHALFGLEIIFDKGPNFDEQELTKDLTRLFRQVLPDHVPCEFHLTERERVVVSAASLKQSFLLYLGKSAEVLKWNGPEDSLSDIIGMPPDSIQIRSLIRDLHGSSEFRLLSRSAANYFTQFGHRSSAAAWHVAISEFFARQEIYSTIAGGRAVDSEACFVEFMQEFTRSEDNLTFLVPLHGISFKGVRIESERFSLVRLTGDELSAKIFSNIPEPHNQHQELLEFISRYWFIEVKVLAPVRKVGFFPVDSGHYMLEANASIPNDANSALSYLSLIKWPRVTGDPQWFRFSQKGNFEGKYIPADDRPLLRIPFVIKLRNGRGTLPGRLDSFMSRLSDEEEMDWSGGFDSEGNEVEGAEVPRALGYYTSPDSAETDHLLNQIRIVDSLRSSKNVESSYLDRSLDFLLLGASSRELQQAFIWNILVLETLFGSKEEATASIGRGIEHVYSDSETGGSGESKFFRKTLYQLRSRLLHGSVGTSDIDYESAMIARVMARDSVDWTLQLLSQIDAPLISRDVGGRFLQDHLLLILRVPSSEMELYKIIFSHLKL